MKFRIVSITILCFLGILLIFMAGCVSPMPGVETTREFRASYNVSHAKSVEVHNINGAVEIGTDAQDLAQVNATLSTLYGSSELDRVQILVSSGPVLYIDTVHPSPPARVTVNYLIRIPRTLPVSTIESTNGAIIVKGAMGTASLVTSNGPIRVEAFAGDLTSRTSNAQILLQEVQGRVSATTSNGAITLQNVSSIVQTETSNGKIDADILSAEQDITMTTSNAGVTARLAPGLDADLMISTSNGQILLNDVPVTVQQATKTELRGRIGQGGNQITITTSNADVELMMLNG
jgi:hypothetical protein